MTEIEKSINKDQLLAIIDNLKEAISSNNSQSICIDDANIALPTNFTCELEYEEEDGKAELELEFKWHTDQKVGISDNSHKPTGTFEVFLGKDSQWYFHLRAANHQIILVSQGYSTKEAAKKGITSVKNNAHSEYFEPRTSTAKQPYFVLKAKNGEIIGCSQMYRRKCGCDKGIRSVIHHASNAEVTEI